jgi:hypothetical protein
LKTNLDKIDISSPVYPDNPKTVCFIHTCTINNWMEILNRQLERLYSSGLYEKLDAIFLNISTQNIEGELDIKGFLTKYNKIQHKITNGLERYERPTLEWLYEFSNTCSKNVRILYFHTKGVSRYTSTFYPNVKDWTNLMETVLIDNYTTCFGCLEKADTCGVNYVQVPTHHFSGNFWWANSNYIKQLNPKIGPAYCDPEFWTLTNDNVKFCCIFNSNTNHYNKPFPSENIPTSFQPIFYLKNKNDIQIYE